VKALLFCGGKSSVTFEEQEAAYNTAYDLLRTLVREFEADLGDEMEGLEIGVDFPALWNLSRSYVDDLHRYAAYHNAPIPDHVRRCAYLCKWLMKFRPLLVRNPTAPKEEEIETFALMANEIFTARCTSNLMAVDWSELSPELMELFLYTLRHRSNSEDTFILFFAHLCHL
jgi:hypothetical protein